MAEFKDVMKKLKEMCDYYDFCRKCPLEELRIKHNITCIALLKSYPEEVEDVIMAWEKPVDWSKVPIDTKILVRNDKTDIWYKRHFAKCENGKVYAWMDGTTSFTVLNDCYISVWEFAKLAEEGEPEK